MPSVGRIKAPMFTSRAGVNTLPEKVTIRAIEKRNHLNGPYTDADLKATKKLLVDFQIIHRDDFDTWKPPENVKTYSQLLTYQRTLVRKKMATL